MPDPDAAVLITESAQLDALVARLVEVDRYAVDTEFHRERTYFPQLALLQVATVDQVFLVDPLAVDPAPLAKVFAGEGLALMHAAKQDLEVLDHAVGSSPTHIFDTQVAGGFLGYTAPSLAALLDRELGVRAPKADRLTDWLRRPLTDRQLRYAAADVAHLHALHDSLGGRLEELGRSEWVREATEELAAEPRGPRNPEDAWRRIKEVRHLKGADLATAQAIAAWRESRAAQLDLTPRYVLADLGVVGLAVARPATAEDLKDIRGVDGRALRHVADELLAVIAEAADRRPRRDAAPVATELPAELRPALPLVAAWVGQHARDLRIEASLLASRADIEALLRGDADARLTQGWRRDLVGEPIRQLVAGEVALAFDRRGGLVLEPRQATPAGSAPEGDQGTDGDHPQDPEGH